MKIAHTGAASTTSIAPAIKPRGLENAIQRVQANIDRRAARANAEHADGHVPGANALAQLQSNLARESGPGDKVEITPVEPAPPADRVQPDEIAPAPLPTPEPTPGALIDILA
jgi:hypothetical protein